MEKIKYSNIIPFKGYSAINLFGLIIGRKEYGTLSKSTINHEIIHSAQALDFCKGFIGFVIFYMLYFLEWVFNLLPSLFTGNNAYRSISFEQEAYEHEREYTYLPNRKRFDWIKYVFKLKK